MAIQPLYFFHIPRTAGTSLKRWLREFYDFDRCCRYAHLAELQNLSPTELSKFDFFGGHFGFEIYSILGKRIPTVTWLREPAERSFSSYHHIVKNKDELISIAQSLSMDSLVQYYEEVGRLSFAEYSKLYEGYVDNFQVRYLSGQPPISNEFRECDDDMLVAALKNLDSFLHVGICEWMQPSVDLLCYRLGWVSRCFDLRLNQTLERREPKSHFASLEKHDKETVIETNRYDFILYNYAREKFRESFQEMWNQILSHEEALESTLSTPCDSGSERFDYSPQVEVLEDDFFEAYTTLSKEYVASFLEERFQSSHQADNRQNFLSVSCSGTVFHTGWQSRQYYCEKQEWFRWNASGQVSAVYLALKVGLWYRFSCSVLFKGDSLDVLKRLELQVNREDIYLEFIPIHRDANELHYIVTGVLSPDMIPEEQTYTKIVFSMRDKDYSYLMSSEGGVYAVGDIYVEPFNKDSSPFQMLLASRRHS